MYTPKRLKYYTVHSLSPDLGNKPTLVLYYKLIIVLGVILQKVIFNKSLLGMNIIYLRLVDIF